MGRKNIYPQGEEQDKGLGLTKKGGYNNPLCIALNCFPKNIAMKKLFLLQIFYVFLTITLLSLFWELVLEGHLFAEGEEGFDEKIEILSTVIIFSLLALSYPTYKGLSLIRNWEQLEKVLIDQGMELDEGDKKKLASLDSIKFILMDELHRRKKAEDKIRNERQKFFNMLDQLPICFHLQADDYTVPFANKMFKKRFGSPDVGMCYRLMHNRSKPCEPCSTFRIFDSHATASNIWTSQNGKTYWTVVTPFEDMDGSTLIMEMAIDITSEQKAHHIYIHTTHTHTHTLTHRSLDT